jgi:hypothetical protein
MDKLGKVSVTLPVVRLNEILCSGARLGKNLLVHRPNNLFMSLTKSICATGQELIEVRCAVPSDVRECHWHEVDGQSIDDLCDIVQRGSVWLNARSDVTLFLVASHFCRRV